MVSPSSSSYNLNQPWIKNYPPTLKWHLDLPVCTLTSLLEQAVKNYPTNPCVNFLGKKLTYQQMAQLVAQTAAGLQQQGVVKGTRVGLFMPNTPYYIIFYYAILKVGGIVVNFNPLYASSEIKHQLKDSGAEFMVTLDLQALLPKLLEHLEDVKKLIVCPLKEMLPFPKSMLFEVLKRKEICRPTGTKILYFKQLIESSWVLQPVPVEAQTDIAVIQYTGGTTGVPKGAMLTHFNLYTNVEQCSHWFSPHVAMGQEKMLAVLPFFHVFAMTVVMNLTLRVGGEIIIMFPRFDVLGAMKLIQKHQITCLPAVPTIYSLINHHPQQSRYSLKSLKACLSGGAPLHLEIKSTFEKLTGATLVEGYGLSEASPVVSANPLNALNKAGSVGFPFPQTHFKIVSLEDPTLEMPLGEKGQILVQGPQVMTGYWNNPTATQEILKDGFLHTGDIGYIDEEGYIFIVDRLKDMIIVNGYNVYPRIVEEALYKHENVEEVTVIGIPDDQRGEMVKAFVKLKADRILTSSELRNFLKDKLSPLEIPKLIEFRDTLPKTMIGKLSKKELVAQEKEKIKNDIKK